SGVQAIPDDPQLHFLLGQSYQRTGNKSKALEEYEISSQLIPLHYRPPNVLMAEISIQLAKSLQDLGEIDKAMQTLKQVFEASPASHEIASTYGEMLLSLGEFKTALAPLDAARKSTPEIPEAHMNYASALIALKQDLDAARSALQVAMDIDPKNPVAKALLAEASYLGGTPEDAIALFEDALDTNLANDPAWQKRLNLGLAKAALKTGQPDLAIRAVKKTQKASEPDSSILKLLSDAHYQSSNFEEALEAARQAYSLSPDDEEVIAWFGDQAFKLNATEDAIIALEKAYAHDPHKTDLLVQIGHLQWQTDDPEKAKRTLAKLFRSKHATAENLRVAANDLIKVGDTHEAIKFLNRAVDLNNASPSNELLHELTQAYQQIGEAKAALKTLERNIALTPNDPNLLGTKAKLLMELGRTKAAMESIEKSLNLNPDNSQLHHDAATILRNSGDFTTAEEHAVSALRLDTDNPKYQLLAAEIYHSNLKPKLALSLLNTKSWIYIDIENKAIGPVDDKQLSSLKFYAALALDEGDTTTSRDLLEITSNENDTEVYALRAWLAALSGDTATAKKSFDIAMSRFKKPKDNLPITVNISSVRSSMANAALAIQDWETATRLFREAASNSPSEPLAQFNIAKTLVLRAEFQRACQALEAIQHAPGRKSLNSQSKDEFENAIDAALRLAHDPEATKRIRHWRTRGRDVFAQDNLENERPKTYPETPGESASLIAAMHRTGDIDQGREIAAKESNHPAVLAQIALLLAKDNTREAVQKAKMAADLAPGPLNQALLATLSQHTGNAHLAIDGIEQALVDWPDEPRWHLLAGKLHAKIGQTNAAIAHLQKAAQSEPDYYLHHLYLGKAYLKMDSPEEAIQALNTAVGLNGNDPEGWLGLANAQLTSGDVSKAAKYAKRATKLAPQHAAPILLNAKIDLRSNQPEKAQKQIQRGLISNPNDHALMSLLAETYVALNRPEDALKAIEKAIENSGNPTQLLLERIRLIDSAKGSKAALKTMRDLAKKYPDEAKILSELSNRLLQAGKIKEAIRVLQHAVKANKDSVEPHELGQLHFQLGVQLHQAGQLDQALHHLSESIDLAPHFLDAYLEIGQVHQKRRQPQEALEYFQRATGIAPHDPRPFVETGLAMKESKDFANAESMLRTASALAPKDPVIQRSLAAIVALNLVHPTTANQ
ncbi:MAG: tetratricopeptide repeat protein, partial [Chloroflexi bacterium]|nr:tetratricopeptide repeat protein [Chloroflexota bacterium]